MPNNLRLETWLGLVARDLRLDLSLPLKDLDLTWTSKKWLVNISAVGQWQVKGWCHTSSGLHCDNPDPDIFTVFTVITLIPTYFFTVNFKFTVKKMAARNNSSYPDIIHWYHFKFDKFTLKLQSKNVYFINWNNLNIPTFLQWIEQTFI